MYESFFGLRERPFSAAPIAKRYFPAQAAEDARHTLLRCIERAEGVGLLIGPAGCGKSLLCQVLAEQFRSRLSVALLASGQLCTRRALLQAILFELGLPYRGMEEGELRLSLVDYLAPRSPGNAAPVPSGLLLIVDEAHTLPLRLMEELRLLTNLVRNGQPRVRLILAGGPQLEERFASPKLEALNQRVVARCYLQSLDRQQTCDYIRHQIDQVGGNADQLFTADALEAVHHATDGIPRLINQVCDHALLLAFANEVRQVNAAGVEEAWSDLQQLPAPWNSADGASQDELGVIEFGSLDDEGPAAVPFRVAQAVGDPTGPLHQLDQIQAHIADIDDDFTPAGSIHPEIELDMQSPASSFQSQFEDEQIVFDRYTTIETDVLANCPKVRSSESGELGALLTDAAAPVRPKVAVAAQSWPGGIPDEPSAAPGRATRKTTRIEPAAEAIKPAAPVAAPSATPASKSQTELPEPDDSDLIVIEDTVESTPAPVSARVRRREYRQLFAQLRGR